MLRFFQWILEAKEFGKKKLIADLIQFFIDKIGTPVFFCRYSEREGGSDRHRMTCYII